MLFRMAFEGNSQMFSKQSMDLHTLLSYAHPNTVSVFKFPFELFFIGSYLGRGREEGAAEATVLVNSDLSTGLGTCCAQERK